MQYLKKDQHKETYFDQKYNLSKIKRECYQMIAQSRKGEEAGYYQIVDTLDSLTFVDNSCDDYKKELLQVIDEMIALDDISFNIDKLYNIRKALSN